MSDTPETLAAILAEMRAAAKSTDLFNGEEVGEPLIRGTKVEEWADRIEAAAEREREKQNDECNEAFDNGCQFVLREMPEGNAAAMREALEVIANEIRIWRASIVGITPDERRLLNVARCALAAPARNCDRFATAAKAMHEWERHKTTAPIPPGGWCLGDVFAWLFDTAEGGVK